MYRNTRFGELLKGLSRGSFEKTVDQFQADKYSKGFRCWDQLVAMIYGQVSGCRSLRELEAGFNSQSIHHYHLGTRSIKRSTLADANAHKDVRVYEQTCKLLLSAMHRQVRKECSDMLYLLDSTPIPLKGLGYDRWTKENKTHRTQGLKAHMMIASTQGAPVYLDITPPNVNDVVAGHSIELEPGATYVFDKGYCDYNWWYQFTEKKAWFVTRFKSNAGLKLERELKVLSKDKGTILKDEIVAFKNRRPGGNRINQHYDTPLRRITVSREGKAPLVLATNDMKRPATQIAELYKSRWDIELFFKWLKQNLKIKQFLGRSENAVRLQIYIAIITYCLMWCYRKTQGLGASMHLCLAALKTSMFQRPEMERKVMRRRQREHWQRQQIQGILAL